MQEGNQYFFVRNAQEPSTEAKNEALAGQLWEYSVGIIADFEKRTPAAAATAASATTAGAAAGGAPAAAPAVGGAGTAEAAPTPSTATAATAAGTA